MSAPSPRFACPRCHSALSSLAADELLCPDEGSLYRREAGIWRFLLPERAAAFERFTREYETVRRGEGLPRGHHARTRAGGAGSP